MRRSILVLAVVVCAMPVLGQAELHEYTLGDDDGFGLGSPVDPGDEISITDWDEYALVADGDGTDEAIFVEPGEIQDFVLAYDEFLSITVSSLFIQYIDWPKSHPGFLRIDGHQTSFEFPQIVPWDQEAPWDVLAVTIDLMPYVDYLYDGHTTFNLIGGSTDVIVIDYMKLSIDGSVVPLPGAVLLGTLGLSLAGWKLRRP